MLESIRNWLNGSRDYADGVRLLEKLLSDQQLLTVLKKGPNPFRIRRVEKEILEAYDNFISAPKNHDSAPENSISPHKISKKEKVVATPVNVELYESCKREADLLYKKVMNDRAVLFALAAENDFLDPNMPDKIARREKLAIDVVVNYQKVSQLYDRAAYVKEHGRLPETDDSSDSEFDSIPDTLVKQALDNARKAFNKLKKKEATPERVVLMQKHQTNIKKLEQKWRSLQSIGQ